MTAGEIYRYIDSFAPFSTQMNFDNCGFQVGDENAAVTLVLLALDITPDVVREAARRGAQLIISHHPVMFHPLHDLRAGTAPYLLAQNGIAAICAHTNLDLAPGGVNTCLAAGLGLQDVKPLVKEEVSGLPAALVGTLERQYEPRVFADFVKRALGCDGLFFADGSRKISVVGLCSGAGSEYIYDAAEYGCQAFVTGEAKHHELTDARNLGVTLVAAGHYYTEDIVLEPLRERLQKKFPEVNFQRAESARCPVEYR